MTSAASTLENDGYLRRIEGAENGFDQGVS
jgi:hypothetical protein